MSNEKKKGVRTECETFIKKDPKLNETFLDKEWILYYLSSEKGVIPYEMIPCPEPLHNAPRKRQVFFISSFLL